jgi:hypothetical protein
MKTCLFLVLLGLAGTAAYGMVGCPLLPVGSQMKAMSVEATHTALELSSGGVGGTHEVAVSNRIGLTARFGVLPLLDLAATIGTADLRFSDLARGFSDYSADWSVAWGAGARAEVPIPAANWHIVGALNYAGFQPSGRTSNGLKTVESKYLWHEVTPTAAVGYSVGAVLPYLALSKPFLFGRHETTVSLTDIGLSQPSTTVNYSDSKQPLRGTLGVEWKLPEGYSVGAEAATSSDGHWTLSVGLAQVMK